MEMQSKSKRPALARIDSDIDRAVTVVRRDYGGDLQAYVRAVKDHIENERQNDEDRPPSPRRDGANSESKLPS